MSFVLTRFKERIIIDKPFAESLANELRSSQHFDGTILLVANEILLDPSYDLSYNNKSVVNFPGRYDLILVADRFNSQGAKIDLTGPEGEVGKRGPDGCTALPSPPCPTSGRQGSPGGPGKKGEVGGEGKNIKIHASEVQNIEIISDGGAGGKGGTGGRGGNGERIPVGGLQLRGGDGGPGGDGGDGAKAGEIRVLFFNKPVGLTISHHLTSRGGEGGERGEGGQPGQGGGNSPAVKGRRGDRPGEKGAIQTPKQLE